MNVNEYIAERRQAGDGQVVKGITCADGFTLSVQGSKYHYCTPRVDDPPGDTTRWRWATRLRLRTP